MDKIKHSLKLSLKVAAICLVANFLYFIQYLVTGSDYAYMNPFISGFLHTSVSHLTLNFLVIFISLISSVNKKYDWKDIYIITFLISLFYLPISFFGITSIAIGLSGTGYFFITRAAFSCNKLSKGVIIFLAFCEAFCLTNDDGVAHGVHLIGIIFGYVSLKINFLNPLAHKKTQLSLGL